MPIPKQEHKDESISAKMRVYSRIRKWIVDGTLKPGEKLNEAELAGFFSVSRTPVREALMLLAEHGFAEVYPARGSFVTAITLEQTDRLYEAIASIQAVVAVLASRKRTEADVERLRALNGCFEKALRKGNIEQTLEADQAFHEAIAAIAANPHLEAFLRQLQPHCYRVEYLMERNGVLDRSRSAELHARLIAAITAGDRAEAERAAEENWMGEYLADRDKMIAILEREA